jgi:cholesterol transport system auxiliary component
MRPNHPLLSPSPARPRLVACVVALAVAGLLSGCISIFPKEPPVQLYRFGAAENPAASTARTEAPEAASSAGFTLRAAVGSFDRASAGDRLLTLEGDRAAYVANARWVASAQSLFESAMLNRFATSAGPAQLLGRGEQSASDYRLDISVRHFEIRYEAGPHTPPVVEVTISAALDSNGVPTTRQEETFTARTLATEDRVGAIVAAYDQSVGEVLGKLKAWVDAKGKA